jgi:hypothetical protein
MTHVFDQPVLLNVSSSFDIFEKRDTWGAGLGEGFLVS